MQLIALWTRTVTKWHTRAHITRTICDSFVDRFATFDVSRRRRRHHRSCHSCPASIQLENKRNQIKCNLNCRIISNSVISACVDNQMASTERRPRLRQRLRRRRWLQSAWLKPIRPLHININVNFVFVFFASNPSETTHVNQFRIQNEENNWTEEREKEQTKWRKTSSNETQSTRNAPFHIVQSRNRSNFMFYYIFRFVCRFLFVYLIDAISHSVDRWQRTLKVMFLIGTQRQFHEIEHCHVSFLLICLTDWKHSIETFFCDFFFCFSSLRDDKTGEMNKKYFFFVCFENEIPTFCCLSIVIFPASASTDDACDVLLPFRQWTLLTCKLYCA